jgi:hypothetical protein
MRPPILRVDLPNRKSRVLVRIELGADHAEAVALQKQITMKATGTPKIEKAVIEPTFTNNKLPGVEAFEKTEEVLASEDDINNGMVAVQDQARAIAKAAAADPAERARIDDVIRKRAIPAFVAEIPKGGRAVNGWMRARVTGNYRTDYLSRTVANYSGIWANNGKEAVYFETQQIDGSQIHKQTFPADALPPAKTRYFWSMMMLDAVDRRVIANPLNRYLFNKQSGLELNADGSLTLVFAPRLPAGTPESNWMPTPQGRRYNLTYRLYGPAKDVADGTYYPPPLVRSK